MSAKEFYVVIERGEDGYYIGEVPSLRGCFSQGRTIDELLERMQEAIALCLEDEPDAAASLPEFVGVQKVLVNA